MSFLRIRSPYHEPRDIWLGPNHAHVSARGGIRGGLGNPVVYGTLAVGVSNRIGHEDGRRGRKYPPGVSRFVDDSVRKNPDNGGVQAPTTEVQP